MTSKSADQAPDPYLLAERPSYAYQQFRRKSPPPWDSMTSHCNNTETTNRHIMHKVFDGRQARPFMHVLGGSPKARAKSGARSVDAWQRDYNRKGRIDEKVTSLRYEKVTEMKRQALKEAARRQLPVEAIEEEMYQAQSTASKRIDTGLRKVEMVAPSRTYTVGGGPPRLFDGNDKLEDDFCLSDAQDMFRGEAWELMSETLAALDEFKPPPRSLTDKRGSFSSGVTPAALNAAIKRNVKKNHKPDDCNVGAWDLASLKKLLVRKYGTLWSSWRHVLAGDGVWQLSFQMWSKGLRAVGFEGNAKAVWHQLDDDDSGLASFAKLDSQLAKRMLSFRTKVSSKYGESWDVIWEAIDTDHSNQVDLDEFEEVCTNIAYDGDASELFNQLKAHPSRKFLNFEDFTAIPKNFKC